MKKKFAFLLMGNHYEPEHHQACFETEKQLTYIFTVKDFEAAKEKVGELAKQGFGAVELCGAFGEEKTRELIALTEGRIAMGFVTHFPEQDPLFMDFFGK